MKLSKATPKGSNESFMFHHWGYLFHPQTISAYWFAWQLRSPNRLNNVSDCHFILRATSVNTIRWQFLLLIKQSLHTQLDKLGEKFLSHEGSPFLMTSFRLPEDKHLSHNATWQFFTKWMHGNVSSIYIDMYIKENENTTVFTQNQRGMFLIQVRQTGFRRSYEAYHQSKEKRRLYQFCDDNKKIAHNSFFPLKADRYIYLTIKEVLGDLIKLDFWMVYGLSSFMLVSVYLHTPSGKLFYLFSTSFSPMGWFALMSISLSIHTQLSTKKWSSQEL